MTDAFMPAGESASNPIVFVENGHARTTSLNVAAFFGKRHADVVRAIRYLIQSEPSLSQRNFALARYTDEQGKTRTSFAMDRDGFTLIGMSFTGPNALRFKLAYIQEFNRMEAALQDNAPPPHKEFPFWPLTELRAKTAVADLYRMTFGPITAQWIMPRLGFPIPPRELVSLGRQMSLELGDPIQEKTAA